MQAEFWKGALLRVEENGSWLRIIYYVMLCYIAVCFVVLCCVILYYIIAYHITLCFI
jgi:tellurite resistance protein TehA-like permease